jgi:NADPH:quinone reductase-like Zn-dependent oxidoreductase
VIDRTYALDDAADALRHVASGHTRGKVLVAV